MKVRMERLYYSAKASEIATKTAEIGPIGLLGEYVSPEWPKSEGGGCCRTVFRATCYSSAEGTE
jgi:hypothetical protein